MMYRFVIPFQMPNLNDYLAAERVNCRGPKGHFTTKGNELKKEWQKIVVACIRRDLKCINIHKPVNIHYSFFEPNKKRDKDNIASFAMKIIQDALVTSHTLKNDGWKQINNFSHEFYIDKQKPRVEVILEELEEE